MNLCPKCNNEIAEGVSFCASCGCTVKNVKCPRCRKQIGGGLAFCASCGCPANQEKTDVFLASTKGGIAKQVVTGLFKAMLLIFVVGLVIVVLAVLFSDNGGSSRGITLAQYNRLEIGMSHSEAMNIVRPHATRSSELGTGTIFHTVTYTVEGSGSTGANAILQFQGNPLRLTTKTQVGLR